MKRLCFELVDFDGDIVSTVEETDPFTVPVWHGRSSPLFRKSASLHFHMLGARGLSGSKETWPRYTEQLHELTFLYEPTDSGQWAYIISVSSQPKQSGAVTRCLRPAVSRESWSTQCPN